MPCVIKIILYLLNDFIITGLLSVGTCCLKPIVNNIMVPTHNIALHISCK